MTSGGIISWPIDGKAMQTVTAFILLASKVTADGDCRMKLKVTYSLEEKYDKPRQHIKKHRYHSASKGPSNQRYGFSSSDVWVRKL